jgi:LacI family transcriptional regulator
MRAGYGREVLRGIHRYSRHFADWSHPGSGDYLMGLPEITRHDPPDGVLCSIRCEQDLQKLLTLPCPCVNVSGTVAAAPFPRVGLDDHAVGEVGADSLIALGLQHFAFCGLRSDRAFSEGRCAGFVRRLSEAGHACNAPRDLPLNEAALAPWFEALPKPVGILCSTDKTAYIAARVAQWKGVPVPEEMALLGVGNDELRCSLSVPTLSSIRVPAEEIGFRAAELLDHLMAGEPPPPGPLLLHPGPVVQRASTDMLAVDDEAVRNALSFIRQHHRDPISVDHVVQATTISRRALEQRFRHHTGLTINCHIQALRINHAKELLVGTDLPVARIAERAGFATGEYLSKIFRKHENTSPKRYRQDFRGGR